MGEKAKDKTLAVLNKLAEIAKETGYTQA